MEDWEQTERQDVVRQVLERISVLLCGETEETEGHCLLLCHLFDHSGSYPVSDSWVFIDKE